jgi:hypothetical protein
MKSTRTVYEIRLESDQFFLNPFGYIYRMRKKTPHIRLFNMRALETLHFTLIRFYFGVVVRNVSSFYNLLFLNFPFPLPQGY